LNSSQFTIQPIRSEDIGDVIAIAEECGLSPWSLNDYLEESKRNDATLLRLQDKSAATIGFLVGRRVMSASSETHFDAEIYNIGVRLPYQRSGCGTILLEEFLKRCGSEMVETVWLDVRISNRGAVSFYKRFGFKEFTVRKSFYTDPPEDGMVMKLTIGKQNS
jgi:[ribosomal protein S18]-alanine N-acetyltransferase